MTNTNIKTKQKNYIKKNVFLCFYEIKKNKQNKNKTNTTKNNKNKQNKN